MPDSPDVVPGRLPPIGSVAVEPAEKTLKRVVWVLNEVTKRATRRRWLGQEKVPPTGGVVFAVNHISNLDPIVFGQFLAYAGRYPHYLGKASLFKIPVIGRIIRACGQIPVERGTSNAVHALSAAVEEVRKGRSITVFPEGTITLDPDLWPMQGKTGVARLALETRAPVIPVGTWGAQAIIGAKQVHLPKLWPLVTLQVKAGDPVDLDDLRAQPVTPANLREATDRIMRAVTRLVADLRGEEPPELVLKPSTPRDPNAPEAPGTP